LDHTRVTRGIVINLAYFIMTAGSLFFLLLINNNNNNLYSAICKASWAQCQCQWVYLCSASSVYNPLMHSVHLYRTNRNVFRKRLNAHSVTFELRAGVGL